MADHQAFLATEFWEVSYRHEKCYNYEVSDTDVKVTTRIWKLPLLCPHPSGAFSISIEGTSYAFCLPVIPDYGAVSVQPAQSAGI